MKRGLYFASFLCVISNRIDVWTVLGMPRVYIDPSPFRRTRLFAAGIPTPSNPTLLLFSLLTVRTQTSRKWRWRNAWPGAGMAVKLEIRQSEKDVGWAWREQALVVGRWGNHYANGYLQQGACACMACVGTDLCLLYRPKYHQVWMTTTGFSLRASCSFGYSIYSAPVRMCQSTCQ